VCPICSRKFWDVGLLMMHQALCGHCASEEDGEFPSIVSHAGARMRQYGEVAIRCEIRCDGPYSLCGLEVHVRSLAHLEAVQGTAKTTRNARRALGASIVEQEEDEDDEEGGVPLGGIS